MSQEDTMVSRESRSRVETALKMQTLVCGPAASHMVNLWDIG